MRVKLATIPPPGSLRRTLAHVLSFTKFGLVDSYAVAAAMSVLPNSEAELTDREGSTISEQTFASVSVLTPGTMSEASMEKQDLAPHGARPRIENRHETTAEGCRPTASLASLVFGIIVIPAFLFILTGPPQIESWFRLGCLSISFELRPSSGSIVSQSPAQTQVFHSPSESRAQQVRADEIDDHDLLERILEISRPTQDEKRALSLIATKTW